MSHWDNETTEWYAETFGEYATNSLTIDALALKEDTVLVDIGCGTGSALRYASKTVTSGRLIGLDPTARMLEIARERLEGHPQAGRIELYQAPAQELPLDDNSADVVMALDSFDHWGDNREQGLKEVRRVLRSQGQFVLIKDQSAPLFGSTREIQEALLQEAGFVQLEERLIEQDDVAFVLWRFSPNKP